MGAGGAGCAVAFALMDLGLRTLILHDTDPARAATRDAIALCAAAIAYARDGFEVHPFMWGEIYQQMNLFGKSAESREIFFPNNRMVHPGELLIQKKAADTLERLVTEGNAFFYHGDFAKDYCAVVKADGYGHGVLVAARAALEGGATGLCVALVQEGVELRRAGIDAPVLVLSEQPHDELAAAVQHGLQLTVYRHETVGALEALGAESHPVHLKIDRKSVV